MTTTELVTLIGRAIESAPGCVMSAVDGAMDPCDGLQGCNKCLESASYSVLASLSRAGVRLLDNAPNAKWLA
jgi:hypothetical protein